MRKTLEELLMRTVSVIDYINHMDEPSRDRFLERMKVYSLKEDVVDELKKYVDEKDRVFRGLKKDVFNPNEV